MASLYAINHVFNFENLFVLKMTRLVLVNRTGTCLQSTLVELLLKLKMKERVRRSSLTKRASMTD